MPDLVKEVNSLFTDDCEIDFFKVLSYDGKTLVIGAGKDLVYAHSFELIFHDVYHFKGDFEWSRDDERDLLTIEDVVEDPLNGRFKFVLFSDGYHYSNHDRRIEIWAASFSYKTDTVFHFKGNDQRPGPRLLD